jgi:O-antigen ligase
VFSKEIPSRGYVWARDPIAIILGVLIAIAVPAILVSPRLCVVLLPLVVMLSTWPLSESRNLRQFALRQDGLTMSVGVFLFYALVRSCLPPEPGAGTGKVILLTTIVWATLGAIRLISTEDRLRTLTVGEGLWVGLLIGLVYYAFEGLTDQGLKVWVINALGFSQQTLQADDQFIWSNGELVEMGVAAFTRAATPISLLVWPAMMAALGGVARPTNQYCAIALFVLAPLAAFVSPHESTKTAIIASIVVFWLAHLSTRWAHRLVATLWIIACLAVIPTAALMHKLDLHSSDWLQVSARHRIVIWNYTAERIMEAPIVGIGPYMTHLKGLELSSDDAGAFDGGYEKSLNVHSHNAFLQTWLELGAVGAILLMAAGLSVLARVRNFHSRARPYALATFTSATALLASSYGMWQSWFLSLFATTAILFAICARVLEAVGGPGSIIDDHV